jgi:hypothetical protein
MASVPAGPDSLRPAKTEHSKKVPTRSPCATTATQQGGPIWGKRSHPTPNPAPFSRGGEQVRQTGGHLLCFRSPFSRGGVVLSFPELHCSQIAHTDTRSP